MTGGFRLLACFAALVLAGCGAPDDAAPAEPRTGSRVSDDNVFSDQVRALEKAEDVSRMLNESAARQREQVERDSR